MAWATAEGFGYLLAGPAVDHALLLHRPAEHGLWLPGDEVRG
jgi:hypothetical protein